MAGTNNSGEDSTSPLTVATAGNLLDRLLLSDEEPQDETEPQAEGETPEANDPESDPASEPGDDDAQDESDAEDEETEEEEEAEVAKPKLHRVKEGDKEIEVSEDELKSGYLRQSDYTRKTQAVAEEKKQLAAEKAEGATQREQLATKLKALDDVLKEQTPPEPDWNQLRKEMKTDEFNATWIAWQEHGKKLATVAKARQEAEKAVFEDQKAKYEAFVSGEHAKLLEAIPEWKDQAKLKAEMTKIVEFAVNTLGFDRKELGTVVDHRTIKMVRDAYRYHEIVAKRTAAKTQVEKTGKVVPPSGKSSEKKPVTKLARANMRLAKTGSVNDAAAALLEIPGLIK